MNITRTQQGPVNVWQIQGRLDVSSVPDLETTTEQVIEQGLTNVIIDLQLLDYISSAGLRSLLLVAKKLQAAQGKLVLSTPTPPVKEILDMAGFASIIPIHAEFSQALTAFDGNAASGTTPSLSLAEELYLLALDTKRGTRKSMVAFTFDYIIAGALLMELALLNRVDYDLTTVKVVDPTPTGNPLLDKALAELTSGERAESPTFWLKLLAYQADQMEEAVVHSLVDKGLLHREERKLLWVFTKKHYALTDDTEVKEVRTRLRELILSEEIPSPRDVVLVSLGQASGLLTDLFTEQERSAADRRISVLVKLDLIGQEMAACIRDIQSALADTSVMGM